MAAPNIISATTINGKTATVVASGTSSTALLANASSSGKCLRITYLAVSNIDTVACNVTVNIHSNGSGGGTAYPLVSVLSVPANQTITLVNGGCIYLEEDRSIYFIAGTSGKINAFAAYEEIS